jgi:hypothetical protein
MSNENDPITLAEACSGFFGGKITVATLRAERDRGTLTVFRIGKRDFTTIMHLREMMQRCRVEIPGSISIQPNKGLSKTEVESAAKAALETVMMLKASPKNRR